MAVSFEHLGRGSTAAVVIHGIDTLPAIRHLCTELQNGAGPADAIVVLDLTDVPVVAQAAEPELAAAARLLGRSHRWLGIVEPRHAAAAPRDGWYSSSSRAVQAGRDYLGWVSGGSNTGTHVVALAGGAAGVVAWVTEVVAVAAGDCYRIVGHHVRRALGYGIR